MKYRIKEVGVNRVWATFTTATELKPGAALDELKARVKSERLPRGTAYELEVQDPRKGWVRVPGQGA